MKGYQYITVFVLILIGCTEPLEIDGEVRSTTNISDILVVEALLTNERKQHVVSLRRGSNFNTDSLTLIRNREFNVIKSV